MPQLFKIGSYIIYFWPKESDPLEPVHVHIAEGRATANATKIWITNSGKALPCDNNVFCYYRAERKQAGCSREASRSSWPALTIFQ